MTRDVQLSVTTTSMHHVIYKHILSAQAFQVDRSGTQSSNELNYRRRSMLLPRRAFPSSFNPGIALNITVFWRI